MTKTTIPWLDSPGEFPSTALALEYPPGLLAASMEINADWLEASYARGIFPWYSQGEPVLWWSTSPRAVLYTAELEIGCSFRLSWFQIAIIDRFSARIEIVPKNSRFFEKQMGKSNNGQ